jgi:hypothetical protein
MFLPVQLDAVLEELEIHPQCVKVAEGNPASTLVPFPAPAIELLDSPAAPTGKVGQGKRATARTVGQISQGVASPDVDSGTGRGEQRETGRRASCRSWLVEQGSMVRADGEGGPAVGSLQ